MDLASAAPITPNLTAASGAPAAAGGTPASEKVRRALRAEAADALPASQVADMKVKADRCILDGFVPVVEHCIRNNLSEEDVMDMSEAAEAVFYDAAVFKLGAGTSVIQKNFADKLTAVLANQGEDACGPCAVLST